MLRHRLIPAVVLALAVAPVAQAVITIDGSLTGETDYGPAKSVQTNNTGFSDSTVGDGTSAGGSELDAAYAVVQGGNLHLFFAGNLKRAEEYNHYDIYIADGRAGQNTVNASGALSGSNGSKFSPGFSATYALDINTDSTTYVNRYDMTQTLASSSYLNGFPNSSGTSHNLLDGVVASFNNSNAAGVVGGAPSAADQAAAAAVTTGLELSIPLARLGNPVGGQLKVLAVLNGGGNDFLSNQFLPGLPGEPVGNLGNGGVFDFSLQPNMFFTVNVPVVSNVGTWASTTGGSWATASNWTGPVPQNATDTAILGSAITANSTITLDGSKTVGRLVFNNTFKYTVATGTGGQLNINDTGNTSGENPSISVQAGSHEITANVQLTNGVGINTVDNTALTLSGMISGAGDVRKSGGGVLVLNGSNGLNTTVFTEAGTTQINSALSAGTSTFVLGDPDADNLPASLALGVNGLTIANDIVTKRDLANNSNLRTISVPDNSAGTLNGAIVINGGVVFAAGANGILTVNSVIQNGTDSGDSLKYDVRVAGAGQVILTNDSIATGDTFVDGGTLVVAAGASLSGGSLNVFTGGVADIKQLDGLASGVKIYTAGTVLLPGNTTGAPVTFNTATLSVDSAGTITIGQSATSANPVVVNAGSVEFLNAFTGKIDLTNNQLITTNDQNTVRQQLLAGNIFTSSASTGATLGYKDTGAATTQIQFAVAGDANLNGKVDTIDFNDLAGNFGTGTTWTAGDFNYDGLIDSLDFGILTANFGRSLPVAAPALGSVVPEPATLSLFAAALPFLGRRRNRLA